MTKFRLTKVTEQIKCENVFLHKGAFFGIAVDSNGNCYHCFTDHRKLEIEQFDGVYFFVYILDNKGWGLHLIKESDATFDVADAHRAETYEECMEFPYFLGGFSPNEKMRKTEEYRNYIGTIIEESIAPEGTPRFEK